MRGTTIGVPPGSVWAKKAQETGSMRKECGKVKKMLLVNWGTGELGNLVATTKTKRGQFCGINTAAYLADFVALVFYF